MTRLSLSRCAGPRWLERIDALRQRGIANGFVSGLCLTGVRLAVGCFWITRVLANPPPTFGCPDSGYCRLLDQAIHAPLIPTYGNFLDVVVHPNPLIFGWFTALVEIGVGMSLVLGLLTRLGAFVAMILALALLIGMAAVPGETIWYYLSLILLAAVFLAIGGTNQLSVDYLARWRTWWGSTY